MTVATYALGMQASPSDGERQRLPGRSRPSPALPPDVALSTLNGVVSNREQLLVVLVVGVGVACAPAGLLLGGFAGLDAAAASSHFFSWSLPFSTPLGLSVREWEQLLIDANIELKLVL